MKKFRDQDIHHLKNSILTTEDLFWILRQLYLLADYIYQKNKSRQREAIQLFFAVDKLIQSPNSLELKFYDILSEIQSQFRIACGINHLFWSMFYRDHCDRKLLLMEKDKEHYTFARGLGTILQIINEAVPNLFVTRISESGRKELTATLALIDKTLPSKKEIEEANDVFKLI